MKYAVNLDRPTHQITIHQADCPEYLEWVGRKDPANGQWFGEYQIIEEARARADYEAKLLGWANISPPPCRRFPDPSKLVVEPL